MLLAGDVGGTKTLLGLFERAERRPRPRLIREYNTDTFTSFSDILDTFICDVTFPLTIDAAAVGVAGPVVSGAAQLTNVDWNVTNSEIAARLGTNRTRLLNDLEALAMSADLLGPDEMVALQRGVPQTDGNAVVIAAGTGLGEAYLPRVNGRLRAVPSEGGHADFAPRTDREIGLLHMLIGLFGRAEVEHVLSGPGLLNIHRFTHEVLPCAMSRPLEGTHAPAYVARAALERTCDACVEAMELFVSAYGAEAGNLALRGVATAGVFVGGGIAPKILPALQDGRFMEAFRAKGSMSALVANMPVKVIVNAEAGLLGAALSAQELLDDGHQVEK